MDSCSFVASTLGAIGDTQAVEPLIVLLAQTNWHARETAINALARIGDSRAVVPLIEMLKQSDNTQEKLRQTIAQALQRLYRSGRLDEIDKLAIISLYGTVIERHYDRISHADDGCSSGRGSFHNDDPAHHSDSPARIFQL